MDVKTSLGKKAKTLIIILIVVAILLAIAAGVYFQIAKSKAEARRNAEQAMQQETAQESVSVEKVPPPLNTYVQDSELVRALKNKNPSECDKITSSAQDKTNCKNEYGTYLSWSEGKNECGIIEGKAEKDLCEMILENKNRCADYTGEEKIFCDVAFSGNTAECNTLTDSHTKDYCIGLPHMIKGLREKNKAECDLIPLERNKEVCNALIQ